MYIPFGRPAFIFTSILFALCLTPGVLYAQKYQANWIRLGSIEAFDYFYDSNSLALTKDGNVTIAARMNNSDNEARKMSSLFKITTPIKYSWLLYVIDVETKSYVVLKAMRYSSDFILLDSYESKTISYTSIKQGSVVDHYTDVALKFKSDKIRGAPSSSKKKNEYDSSTTPKKEKNSVLDKYN